MWTMVAIILLLVGLAFAIAEMFTPGVGVFAVLGVLSLIASAIVTVVFVPFGVFVMVGNAIMSSVILYAALKYLSRRQLCGSLILNETLGFDSDSIGNLDYFIGKEGVAKTALRPVGTGDFNGVSIDVTSDGPFVEKGQRIKVVEVKNNTVVVTQQNKN